MEINFHRSSEGVFIPEKIYSDYRLTNTEKIFLSTICINEDEKKGCTLSREYFSKFLGLSSTFLVGKMISKLTRLEYICTFKCIQRGELKLEKNYEGEKPIKTSITKVFKEMPANPHGFNPKLEED